VVRFNDGTVFEITPSGALTALHSFNVTDGSAPDAGLVQGTDGNFYGTTQMGGANNLGTIFQITSGGTLATLHSFNGTDGNLPQGTLLQATNGNFYGTTTSGGTTNNGTVFSFSVGFSPFVKTLPTSAGRGSPDRNLRDESYWRNQRHVQRHRGFIRRSLDIQHLD
jgi:uncharacterized repeat protein (TIGR03803 family)